MNIKLLLTIVSFLQFSLWGSWLTTLGAYMFNTLHFSGIEVGKIYGTLGIASIVMPPILGIIGDKWLPANRLYIFCHAVGAIALFCAAQQETFSGLYAVMFINSVVYAPTLSLSSTVSYYSLETAGLHITATFPKIRVFGTIGFILAMWSVSLLGFEQTNAQLYIASGASLLLVLVSLMLPCVPIQKSTNEKRSLMTTLGLDAFVLFKSKNMAIFFTFSVLLGAVLQLSNAYANPFISDFVQIPEYANSFLVKYTAIFNSIAQMSEVIFILLVPFFLGRFGIKKVMLISMIAWTLRYAFFAYGNPSDTGLALLLISMLVYGCAFDFYNISGSIYVDGAVPPTIRSSAQGLFQTMTNGLGAFIGAEASGYIVDYYTTTVNEVAVKDWHSIWLIFAGYSLIMAVGFLLLFKDPTKLIHTETYLE